MKRPRKKAGSEPVAQNSNAGGSPVADVDADDPGDETQRNYRYQAAIGAMLIVGMSTGELPYLAVWCEQREDFLGELPDAMFDAVQVKTATPENGAWEVSTAAFVKSIRRFTRLDTTFPNQLRQFLFVSNVDFADSDADAQKHRSIPKLLRAAAAAADHSSLEGAMADAFRSLLEKVNYEQKDKLSAEAVFAVLRRLKLQKGPSREEMQDVLCQSHLPHLAACAEAAPRALAEIAKRLVARVLEASSIQIDAGERHYAAFLEGKRSPELEAKRLTIVDLELILREQKTEAFHYLASLTSLKIGEGRDQAEDTRLMQLKLKQGGIPEESFVILHRQAISAEQRLLDLATRTEHGAEIYSQLENVVRDACSVAAVQASLISDPFGKRMLVEVHKRLREIASAEAERVSSESADMLLGVAGLLTGQCHVWWSEKFDIPAAS